MVTTEPQATGVRADDLQPLLEGRYGALRHQILELFRWWEGRITASIAQRFRRGIDEGYDPFEVFRAVQNHAANAARAHMERVILEASAAAAGPRCKAVTRAVNDLCDEVRGDTEPLVDAFGTPDQVLRAPIALG